MTSRDETFRNFTPEQAAIYAKARGYSYPPALYQAVVDYHKTARRVVFDIGTGPGKVLFDFMQFFERGIGSDTSVQMIEQAKKDAQSRNLSDRTGFLVCSAEDCSSHLSPNEVGNVDLITVAMAVHWFQLPEFYAQAAKALKPGGTLAIWTCSSFYCHPAEPKCKEIQDVLSDLEDKVLDPYMTPGNRLSRRRYIDMTLPWHVDATKTLFDESAFQRKDWDVDGIPSGPSLPDGTPGPFARMDETNIDDWEASIGAAGPVVRWRKANPEKVGTEEDIIRIIVKRLRTVMGERKTFMAGSSTSLLLLRRSAAQA
ncbi:S-adenosyl-L-methionine-dependent methyltransferase [Myriangium duriaei CBS 260.36]|uniref:S-adenosyl-L-methionine-dependent methyltransferase n=1 Tax=Myriangium duriaei CBS 260.36 TaxID=1168546 RepID=A0A9P4MLZ1_9PEZI|nr:S-adenosyl-L-methionine-dependent methyltransferase [Myriangium duriaei CBS 260.36]